MRTGLKVGAAPAKPVLIYDADCGFCRRWVAVWQRRTGEAVEYIPSDAPEISTRFPDIPPGEYDRAVQLVDTEGTVISGAEAAFRALASGESGGTLLWFYHRVRGFDWVSERIYSLIACNRMFFSRLTRWFLPAEPAGYSLIGSMLLRLLGIIYLIAFLSMSVQIIGLVGQQGILPADQLMEAAGQSLKGFEKWQQMPTLAWLGASDAFLKFHCYGGMAFAALLILGLVPLLSSVVLWVLYLSLCVIGRDFLAFQWDNLLLEAGFLAIFLAPVSWRMNWRFGPSLLVIWLYRWLTFRLMFHSGLVKLTSGDATWKNLTALEYHYETQPLPNVLAYYAHHLPDWMHKISVIGMFGIELLLPFFALAPWRFRIVAFIGFVVLQLGIASTGNYTFFNLLTIILCLPLLHDQLVWRVLPRKLREGFATTNSSPAKSSRAVAVLVRFITYARGVALAFVTIGILALSLVYLIGTFSRPTWPSPIIALYQTTAPFRSVNTYGLFAVMTTSRPEIIIEGSGDGTNWLAYEFKFKPGDLKEPPRFVAPHQPRLDWQMWFAALGTYRENPWFINLCLRLLQGAPEVLELLEKNPFPGKPPKYVRARLYDYKFTTRAEKSRTGEWWKRELKGTYLAPISLDMVQTGKQ